MMTIQKNTLWGTLLILLCLILGTPTYTNAQELVTESQQTIRGKVVKVIDERTEEVYGNTFSVQTLEIEILEGPQKGLQVIIESDFKPLKQGNRFYMTYNTDIAGLATYAILDKDRRGALGLLVLLFIGVVIAFGKWQGVRSLVALAISFLAIVYLLLPSILNGWNPLVASALIAGAVLFVAIFFTHGFNKESLVAYSGTMIAVIITSIFAVIAVDITSLSGFASEEAVYLNFNTQGSLNFTALLLGAFIIGFLGVLDDIAVTQSAVVTELYQSNPDATPYDIYKKAMRIGREHVGALVNTLVLAYTGASLPLLLYFNLTPTGFGEIINLEIFATEIVRIIVGSIGLILTVPIVTFLATKYLRGYESKHAHHHHHHGHSHA